MRKILLAGATGYLGSYVLKELLSRQLATRIIARHNIKLPELPGETPAPEILKAELTRPESLTGCCEHIDTVISTVGITRQKDGLTYMDVDYQANMNLLNEAIAAGVRKFIYVSVLNGEHLKQLKICQAKEKFVAALINSGIDYCIIRPNGFFQDMREFSKMAGSGRVYLFGPGKYRANPIHGEDLAQICVHAISSEEKEIKAGGPQILTQNDIAKLALDSVGKPVRITHLPDWIRKFILFTTRTFTSSKTYGPVEFFLTVLAMDMIAPEYGKHTLKEFFETIAKNS
ncbi:Uncharacterized conserved protein YbjT, contains NAD(P)-binding and DUF2867 domains [Chitinophaga eiseniae]|uniref:Uncharacterized conserved protein YbjT, contains NAD(P)-binding and DUF2867 domains n=1 Tax=Chitinophaga eiseniae TaxID=634771 RepID=A0A1T4SMI6_9BACT|nr:SDR family oxidoreductase [Chitinophaga eiseniae]SKA29407.1 Uncharacterized conserved protein YbjT, contains NAD(P)-binding and DUF2867 domains [Chitinophaga eiseniae]